MMPNEASKERKPKHDLESVADELEAEGAEPGMPDFMKDAEALLALEAKRDKMIDQKNELAKAGNVLELKPGVASGAIDKEIDSLQDKVNAVLGKYGKEANAFQIDAYRVGELKDNVADAEAIMRGLEADYKNEKNPDAKAKLERQLEDATAAWQEARNELGGMKDKYVAKEAAAKAELAGATEADIDAALEPLKEATPEEVDVDLTELNEDAREKRIAAMGERVDEKMAAMDKIAQEDPIDVQGLLEIEKQRVKEEEAGKRDTLPDAGMAGRMENVAEDRRDTLVDEPEIEVQAEELIDEPADTKAEDEFFQKGEVIDAVHRAGQTLENRSAAERRGDAGAERAEMAQEAEKLRSQMPEMQRQLARAEKYLNDLGVKDVDGMMTQRAKDGFFGKAKGFLGGLFNKKARELNHAVGLYESVRDQHNEMADKLAKLDMQLNPTDRQKEMARIAMENRQGRQ